MVLANTYHLHLQPGEVLWAGVTLVHGGRTDSNGFGRFQVFSLSKLRKITEFGVTFRSPRDGQVIDLTPERSIQIQNVLGAM